MNLVPYSLLVEQFFDADLLNNVLIYEAGLRIGGAPSKYVDFLAEDATGREHDCFIERGLCFNLLTRLVVVAERNIRNFSVYHVTAADYEGHLTLHV